MKILLIQKYIYFQILGLIYITVDELSNIESKMRENGQGEQYDRFLRRLRKYSFLKQIMRKVNIEKENRFKLLE